MAGLCPWCIGFDPISLACDYHLFCVRSREAGAQLLVGLEVAKMQALASLWALPWALLPVLRILCWSALMFLLHPTARRLTIVPSFTGSMLARTSSLCALCLPCRFAFTHLSLPLAFGCYTSCLLETAGGGFGACTIIVRVGVNRIGLLH